MTARSRILSSAVAVVVLAVIAAVPGVGAAAPGTAPDPVPGTQLRVSPTPQSMRRVGADVAVPASVRLVTSAAADPAATGALRGLFGQRGARLSASGGSALTVYLGTSADSGQRAALAGLDAPDARGLPPGGYVLAAGAGRVVLSGADAAGTFYAVQTLRQLIQRGSGGRLLIPGVQVVDWPQFARRGGEESFYGDPWSRSDLVHQMDFLGQHKMNAFLYTVGNDPHTAGAQWRDPYQATDPDFTTLQAGTAEAAANHVEFMYRIDPEAQEAPSAGICHASTSDLNALVARYQQLWDIGIHTISVGWDDASGQFVCAADRQQFGGDASPLAAAQAYVINYLLQNFVAQHPGAQLITVPAEYAGDASSTYRTRFAQLVPASVQIFWTGPQVVSPTITTADLASAQQAFGRPLLIFDNYPVNDYAPTLQHLGPLVGRDPGLAGNALGLMANEMQQEEASLIPLFTVADYTWNPDAYNAQDSWTRSLQEFGGSQYAALRTYAENSVSSPLTSDVSPVVAPLVDAFVRAYRGHGDVTGTGTALLAELDQDRAAPAALRGGLADSAFLAESAPWLDALADRATAAEAAVRALQARDGGDPAATGTDLDALGTAMAAADTTGVLVAPGVYDDLYSLAAGPRDSSVVRADDGRMSAFEEGTDGQAYTAGQTSPGSSWPAFTALAGTSIAGHPDTIVARSGAMEVFARGSDGAVWTDWQTSAGGGWHGWLRLGGSAAGDPSVAMTGSGVLSVFVRGGDGQLYTAWQSGEGGTWSGFVALPGLTMTGTPEVSVGRNGAMSVFARGSDGAVWTDWQASAGSGWHGWVSLGGHITDSPRVVQTANGAMSLFVRGTDGVVATDWQSTEGGTWSGFVALPGLATTGTPEVVVGDNGAMSVFARGSDGAVWTDWQASAGSGWQGWASLGGGLAGAPRVIRDPNGGCSLFAVGTNNQLQTSWQSTAGSAWSGWVGLGGALTA